MEKKTATLFMNSEALLKIMLENLPGMVYRCRNNREYTAEFITDYCRTLTGYSPEDFMHGGTISYGKLIGKEYRDYVWNEIQKALENREPFRLTYQITTASKEKKWVKEQGRGIFDQNGQLLALERFIEDITDKKNTEEALESEHSLLRTLIDNMPDFAYVKDTKSRFVLSNMSLALFMGASSDEELRGKTDFDYYPAELANEYYEDEQRVMKTKKPMINKQESCIDRQGNHRWVLTTKVPLLDREGNSIGLVGIGRDISDKKKIQDIIENHQKELQTIFDSVPAIIFYKNCENQYIRVNKAFAETQGLKKDEMEGKSCFELWPEFGDLYYRDDLEVIEAGIPKRGIIQPFKTKRGMRWIQIDKVPYRDENGKIIGIIGFGQDITTQKKAEEVLRKSEERYRRFYEEDLTGFFIALISGEITRCNPSFVHMFGFSSNEEALSARLEQLFPTTQMYSEILDLIKEKKKLDQYELELQRFDGKPVHVIANLIGLFNSEKGLNEIKGYLIDITERKYLESRLRQSQKLEALGRLAGGIAHDFNNLLTVINGFSELLLGQLGETGHIGEKILEIRRAGEQAASLTRQLLAFGRKQVLEPKEIDLNAFIRNTEKMLRCLMSEDIDLKTVYAPSLGKIKADPSQIGQVIINLVLNASEAMPKGGTLALKTYNMDIDEHKARKYMDMNPGSYVILSVSDTGEGINPQDFPHIFEPFFTTKTNEKGTGLGLATVHGIVKQSGGHIYVESHQERGTTFTIFFQRFDGFSQHKETPQSIVNSPVGKEIILLAEDDKRVRNLARILLEDQGYTVLVARNSTEAIELSQQHQGTIDMLITDVVMPGMSGGELAKQLLSSKPDIKVLFISGHTDETIIHHGVFDTSAHLLRKPFKPYTLAKKVREILDNEHTPHC